MQTDCVCQVPEDILKKNKKRTKSVKGELTYWSRTGASDIEYSIQTASTEENQIRERRPVSADIITPRSSYQEDVPVNFNGLSTSPSAETNPMKRALDAAIDTISRKAAEVTFQMDSQLGEKTLHQTDTAMNLAMERFKRRLILEKQTLQDAVGAMSAGDVREMSLIRDQLSENILKMDCEINHIVQMMTSQVDVPVEDITNWRAEQKMELGDIKAVFRQLEATIQDCQNYQQQRHEGQTSNQPLTQSHPFTQPKEIRGPRRNLNDEFQTSEEEADAAVIEDARGADKRTDKRQVSLTDHLSWTTPASTESRRQPQDVPHETSSVKEPEESRSREENSLTHQEKFFKKLTDKLTEKNQQTVKLQRYKITPFYGDYGDYIRFANQFQAEVEDSYLPDVSKLSYLLELVRGKARDCISGLPYSAEGYQEAKKILVEKFGRPTQVKRSVLKQIEDLEKINAPNRLEKVHAFTEKLSKSVRTLKTMGVLAEAQALVYPLFDKLGSTKEFIIQRDDDWFKWDLQQLVVNLERYCDRNPVVKEDTRNQASTRNSNQDKGVRRNDFKGARRDVNMMNKPPQSQKKCVFCETDKHPSYECDKVTDVAARKEVLKQKKVCYNCTNPEHGVSQCKSKRTCFHCNKKHHSSICDKPKESNKPSPADGDQKPKEKNYSSQDSSVVHPSALAEVQDKEVRVVIDTLSSSSYISSDLISRLQLKPKKKEKRNIEQMFGSVEKIVEVYEITIHSQSQNFSLKIDCINSEREVITQLPNPRIKELKRRQPQFRKIRFSEENSTARFLPVQILLGVAEYNRIRMAEAPVIGQRPTFPVAEETKLGWILFGGVSEGPAREFCKLAITGQEQFEKLCRIDVLGIQDQADLAFNHESFKEGIQMMKNGHYSTKLPWKIKHEELPDNKYLSTKRLKSTTRKLEKMSKIEAYHKIMKEQLETGILEEAPAIQTGPAVHYIPHSPVFRPDSATTPLRIVYDASARAGPHLPSLNDCLETGPNLLPKIF